MKFIGKAVVVFSIFGAISIIFLTWHSIQHRKEEDSRNTKEVVPRVLIATDSEKSKDSVVAGIINQLTSSTIDIDMIEINQLNYVNEHDWSAIVILSAPENLTAHKNALAFIDNAYVRDKIVLLRASGSTVAIVDIDEMSTASMNKEYAFYTR